MRFPALVRTCRPARSACAVKLLGMVVLVLGVKLWLLQTCAAPLPIFDQWEAEGQNLLRPWLHGTLRPGDLFTPWIQHRIVWTRLLVLGLFQCNGQWDTRVEAVASEVVHVLTALGLGIILVRRLGRAWEDAVLVGLTLLFALPLALANTFSGGFASQYYFLLLFSVVAVWGLCCRPPGSAGWWVGVAGAVAAWFSVASGALPALAVAAWMALRLWRGEGSPRANRLNLGVALALGLGGLSLSLGVGEEQFGVLKPGSVGDLLTRFLGLLGWPLPTPWAAPLACAPFAWLLWRTVVRRDRPTGAAEAFLLPFGLFCLLNTAAIAYARNRYSEQIVSRYMDFLSFNVLVNFFCLLLFLRETGAPGLAARVRAPFGLLTALWVAGTGGGLLRLTALGFDSALPPIKASGKQEVAEVAAYVAQPDAPVPTGKGHFVTLSNDPPLVGRLLHDPLIRRALPAPVRPPLALSAAFASPGVHPSAVGPDGAPAGWVLEPSSSGQAVRFQSRTIHGADLPYLCFPRTGELNDDAFIALVDERAGTASWLPTGTLHGGSRSILVRTPPGPFHVVAVLAAGSTRRLEFASPREVGRLSAWTEPLLDGSTYFIFAGLACWLGAVFWRRLGLHALGAIRFHLPSPARESAGAPGILPPLQGGQPSFRDASSGQLQRDSGTPWP